MAMAEPDRLSQLILFSTSEEGQRLLLDELDDSVGDVTPKAKLLEQVTCCFA
jgi:hypothetical protein